MTKRPHSEAPRKPIGNSPDGFVRKTDEQDEEGRDEEARDEEGGADGEDVAHSSLSPTPGRKENEPVSRDFGSVENPAKNSDERAFATWLSKLDRDPLSKDEIRIAGECYPDADKARRLIDQERDPSPGDFSM
ncbi:hypothetical protein [Paracoccus lutimaris]|uniref:Uncharacterized protein n=1 Tax=Paracoccus lutimaris TaxID=1490030 RepID=A0A368YVD0_9RHOB|nr:hypothetical protein [Paracoccus lutimaris]RCW82907.1 hypothetical protein DFP89_111113 [Paracoccus lutimaris]